MSFPIENIKQGKVRSLIEDDDGHLTMCTSSRISVFDKVLNFQVPNRGVILTQCTIFWCNYLGHICRNHLISCPLPYWADESCVSIQKLEMYPFEFIMRGYDAKPYRWAKYDEPLFTPTTKGEKDVPLTPATLADKIGKGDFFALLDTCQALYEAMTRHCEARGLILADTKFEFGTDADGVLTLADEVGTPDCSRFWDASTYAIGHKPRSLDKDLVREFIRDRGEPATPPHGLIKTVQVAYKHVYDTLTEGFV